MRAAHCILAALAAASIHCGGDDGGGGPDPATFDGDRDGVVRAEDCNDGNAGVWTQVTAHPDADGDGRGATTAVVICAGDALPPGWLAEGSDCDDADPRRWVMGEAYPDADGDGRGGGALTPVCRGDTLPAGWADAATDCAPDDSTRWSEQAYMYRDADGDGLTTYGVGVVCSGDALPPGYAMDPSGQDCDDGNAAAFDWKNAYVDGDRDGHGGEARTICTGYALPVGWATEGGDCDDGNAAAFDWKNAYLDRDYDGHGGEAGTVCAGYALPVGWSTESGDCDDGDAQRWQWLSYAYVDRDYDGYTAYESGTLCGGWGLPSPFSNVPGWRGNGDCDDADATTHLTMYGYADADVDGVGGGPLVTLCTRGWLPEGYLATGGDCAPEDETQWREYAYRYRDADGDGHFVPASGTLCYGTVVPAGYASSAATPYDCDDADALVHTALWGYADEDEDGVGAGQGVLYCTAGTLPTDRVATGTDCAAADKTRWQMLPYAGLDEDGDGFTTRAAGSLCAGAALPDPYRVKAAGNDCDDADTGLWRWTVLYPDADGDGIGTPPREILCLGEAIPAGYSLEGWDAYPADPGVLADAGDAGEPLP